MSKTFKIVVLLFAPLGINEVVLNSFLFKWQAEGRLNVFMMVDRGDFSLDQREEAECQWPVQELTVERFINIIII